MRGTADQKHWFAGKQSNCTCIDIDLARETESQNFRNTSGYLCGAAHIVGSQQDDYAGKGIALMRDGQYTNGT